MQTVWQNRRAALPAPMFAFVLAMATWCITASGCGGPASSGARSVPSAATGIKTLVAALRADDPEKAYALLSREVRQQMSFEAFAKQWRATAAERRDQARTLAEDLDNHPSLEERVRVSYVGGRWVYLAREDGEWRIEAALISPYRAGRPRDAVRLFARALADRDYDGLLRILTERRSTDIGQRVERFVFSLLRHLDSEANTLEFLGPDRAALRWDDGDMRYKIVLHRENDDWRIDDVHLRRAPQSSANTD